MGLELIQEKPAHRVNEALKLSREQFVDLVAVQHHRSLTCCASTGARRSAVALAIHETFDNTPTCRSPTRSQTSR